MHVSAWGGPVTVIDLVFASASREHVPESTSGGRSSLVKTTVRGADLDLCLRRSWSLSRSSSAGGLGADVAEVFAARGFARGVLGAEISLSEKGSPGTSNSPHCGNAATAKPLEDCFRVITPLIFRMPCCRNGALPSYQTRTLELLCGTGGEHGMAG